MCFMTTGKKNHCTKGYVRFLDEIVKKGGKATQNPV